MYVTRMGTLKKAKNIHKSERCQSGSIIQPVLESLQRSNLDNIPTGQKYTKRYEYELTALDSDSVHSVVWEAHTAGLPRHVHNLCVLVHELHMSMQTPCIQNRKQTCCELCHLSFFHDDLNSTGSRLSFVNILTATATKRADHKHLQFCTHC